MKAGKAASRYRTPVEPAPRGRRAGLPLTRTMTANPPPPSLRARVRRTPVEASARVARRAIAFALAVTAATAHAGAAIHKCALPGGGTTYQDRPCDGEAASAGFDASSATLSVTPAPAPATTIVRREAPARPPRAERARRIEAERPGNSVERRHLRVGMSEGEVVARIGRPDFTTGKGRRQSRWTWMPVPGDPDTITVVLFEVGRVVEIERTVVKR